ncbi:MAG: branched-chain amino acid ABC transporter permease [Tistlia sp.]
MVDLFTYLQFVLAPQMVTGLVIGVAVILMALGLTIIFGLLDVINLAHGAFYALGGFVLITLLGLGLDFWVAMVLVPLLVLPAGLVTERLLIQRVFHSGDRHTLTLLLTFGLSLVMEDLFKIIYGPDPHRPQPPISGAVELLGMYLPTYRVFLIFFGALLIAALSLFLFRSDFGARIRAAAYDRHMAASLGIQVKSVYSWTFALGLAVAALSGVLLSPIYGVYPDMGHGFIFLAFAVVIVGGFAASRARSSPGCC